MNAIELTSASFRSQSDSGLDIDLENLTGSSLDSTTPEVKSSVVIFFEVSVIIIGVLGSAANGLVFAVLLRARQSIHRPTYLLILNQLVLDLFSSVVVFASYVVKLSEVTFEGRLGSVLCTLLDSEMILWIGLDGSTTNLVCITLERYAKVIHPIVHRKHFRLWMVRAGIAIAWSTGVLYSVPVTSVTTMVVNKQCLTYAFWHSRKTRVAYGVYYFCLDFVFPLLIFTVCYSRIVRAIHRRMKVLPGLPVGTSSLRSTIQANLWRSQTIIIKTMMIITALFAICWIPNHVYFLLMNLGFRLSMSSDVWHGTVFVAFLHICLHPFICAVKLDTVKKHVLDFLYGRVRVQPVPRPTSAVEPRQIGVPKGVR